jgi:DNA-directed RNA polymerase specialized sigma subunit
MKISIKERNKLIIENEWIVNTVAKKYSSMRNIDIEDLKSNARLFMFNGFNTFKEGKRKLSSHLFDWAKAGALAYLYENRTVHIPWNKINAQHQINKEGGDEKLYHETLSLDFKSTEFENEGSNNDGIQLDSILQNSISGNPTEVYIDSEITEHVQWVVNEDCDLSPIEHFTIVHRFGLNGNDPQTQTYIASLTAQPEITEKLGRSYSVMGINKAEKRAIEKLRNSSIQDAFI